jgi:hypothetical protein
MILVRGNEDSNEYSVYLAMGIMMVTTSALFTTGYLWIGNDHL